ncbi:MAG: hypothetical protein ACOX8W_06465 [bacterium]|jgi:hypothetical protein
MIKLKTCLNHKGLLLKPGETVALPLEVETRMIKDGLAEAPEQAPKVPDAAAAEECKNATVRSTGKAEKNKAGRK